MSDDERAERIRKRAHELYLARGSHANDFSDADWAAAEQEIEQAEKHPTWAPPIHKPQTILQRWLAGTLPKKPLVDKEKK